MVVLRELRLGVGWCVAVVIGGLIVWRCSGAVSDGGDWLLEMGRGLADALCFGRVEWADVSFSGGESG